MYITDIYGYYFDFVIILSAPNAIYHEFGFIGCLLMNIPPKITFMAILAHRYDNQMSH